VLVDDVRQGRRGHEIRQPAGVRLAVRGAPLCYPLTGAFGDGSALTTYGGGWRYKTLISAGK
jgi:hypothetical protein